MQPDAVAPVILSAVQAELPGDSSGERITAGSNSNDGGATAVEGSSVVNLQDAIVKRTEKDDGDEGAPFVTATEGTGEAPGSNAPSSPRSPCSPRSAEERRLARSADGGKSLGELQPFGKRPPPRPPPSPRPQAPDKEDELQTGTLPESWNEGLLEMVKGNRVEELRKLLLQEDDKGRIVPANVPWSRDGPYVSTAALWGHQEVLEVLLEASGDASSVFWGKTALMWAAETGNLSSVHVLLRHGAEVNSLDAEGETALSRAKKEG